MEHDGIVIGVGFSAAVIALVIVTLASAGEWMPYATGSWADPRDRSRLRTWRAGTARRQDRVGHLRLLARQTPEKGGDLVDLVSAELSSELARPHDGDRRRRSQA